MEWVDEREDGDRATQDMRMLLIDRNGDQRRREIRSKRMDRGEDTYSLLFFIAPADVRNTGFLTYDYDDEDRDDDQWLYLPALGKTKRIASTDKSGSFMGSDFSYADMTRRKLDHYDYALLKEDEIRGHRVWIVEATPNTQKEIDDTGYTRSIVFVRQDNHVVVRAKHWTTDRRVKYLDVKKLEKIDGIWVPTEMHMITRRGKATLHRTVLLVSNVEFNQAVDPDDFTLRRLEKGL